MRKYFQLIKKFLLPLGFDVDGKFRESPRISRGLFLLKWINLVVMIIGLVQIWLFVFFGDFSDALYLQTVLIAAFGTQGVLKFVIFIRNIDRMIALQENIECCYNRKLSQARFEENLFFKYIKRFAIGVFYVNLSTVTCIHFIYLIRIIIGFVTNSHPGTVFFYKLYWPFDGYDFLPLTFIYSFLVLTLFEISAFMIDQLAILATTSLAICFEKLGDEIREIIDESDSRTFNETREKLTKCVDSHNQLIEFSNELNSIYGISLLTFVLQCSILVCILEFRTIVSKNLLLNCCFIQKYFFKICYRKQTTLKIE